MTLDEQFDQLAGHTRALIGLLEEADHRFWISYLQRGLRQVEERKLAGATFILGCFGGFETLSDLTLAEEARDSDPLRYRNLNARLTHLRTQTFEAANAIAARRSW